VGDKTLSDMLASGELDAALIARPPNSFRAGHPDVVRLFPDYLAMEEEYFARTRVYPIMHVIAMRRDAVDRNPWVSHNLYRAFEMSKQRSFERLLDPALSRYPLPWLTLYAERMREKFFGDPFPYGIEQNRPTLDLFLQYAFEQGIAQRRVAPDDIFPPGVAAQIRV
jgi:4,5-dihydroxyphthalate decarboxylase